MVLGKLAEFLVRRIWDGGIYDEASSSQLSILEPGLVRGVCTGLARYLQILTSA